MQTNYTVFPILQKLLFSPLCTGCGKELQVGRSICFSCRRLLLAALAAEEDYLLRFIGPVPPLFHGLRKVSPFSSSELVLRLLKRTALLSRWREAGISLVVSAPQRRQEGPSGLALVAAGVAKELGVLYAEGLLQKKGGRAQHGLGYAARVNTECFVELAGAGRAVRGEKILLIDDVLTTGTTLEMCAYVLRKAGAAEVRSFALAHQVMPRLERKREEPHQEGGEVHPLLFHLRV